ncbi:hypothetical protein C8R43DRAFT_1124771 [Mycena crocata]|nr:hypothetical protein C8R43DRAFT_1124771 [Mycena crocata]
MSWPIPSSSNPMLVDPWASAMTQAAPPYATHPPYLYAPPSTPMNYFDVPGAPRPPQRISRNPFPLDPASSASTQYATFATLPSSSTMSPTFPVQREAFEAAYGGVPTPQPAYADLVLLHYIPPFGAPASRRPTPQYYPPRSLHPSPMPSLQSLHPTPGPSPLPLLPQCPSHHPTPCPSPLPLPCQPSPSPCPRYPAAYISPAPVPVDLPSPEALYPRCSPPQQPEQLWYDQELAQPAPPAEFLEQMCQCGCGGPELGPVPRSFTISAAGWTDKDRLSIEGENWFAWAPRVGRALGMVPGTWCFLRLDYNPPDVRHHAAHRRVWEDNTIVVRSYLCEVGGADGAGAYRELRDRRPGMECPIAAS